MGPEAPELLELSDALVMDAASCSASTLKVYSASFLSSKPASPPGPTCAVWLLLYLFYLCLSLITVSPDSNCDTDGDSHFTDRDIKARGLVQRHRAKAL